MSGQSFYQAMTAHIRADEPKPEPEHDEFVTLCPRCELDTLYVLVGGLGQFKIYQCAQCGRQVISRSQP